MSTWRNRLRTVKAIGRAGSLRPDGPWSGTMARSRRRAGKAALKVVGACVVLAVVSGSLVLLSNTVVVARQQIECLQSEKEYLETRLGRLEEDWNRAVSREKVVARAEKELGLIAPDGPGTMVVLTDTATERRLPLLDRVLAAVGGGGGSIAAATAGESRP